MIGVEGLAPDTVSGLLGITATAMRQRLSRARARLLAELERAPARAANEAQRRSSS